MANVSPRISIGIVRLFLLLMSVLMTADPDPAQADPRRYLEEVDGAKAMAWVESQNARSLAALKSDPRYAGLYSDALDVAQDKARLPLGDLLDGYIYNFWQDEAHVRGLWRRATLESYRAPEPAWEILLDLDALAAAENKNWVWKGADCLPPPKTGIGASRCMITLSDGGKDAAVVREFDLATKSFPARGFVLPEAKSRLAWKDSDTLLVSTDWGPGTLSKSGYPLVLKEWRRGDALKEAREIMRGAPDDLALSPVRLDGENGAAALIANKAETFFTASNWLLTPDGPKRLNLPVRATIRALHKGQLIFSIEEDWSAGAVAYETGALLSLPLAEATNPGSAPAAIVLPSATEAVNSVAAIEGGLLIAMTDNVRGRLTRAEFADGAWRTRPIAVPDHGSISLAAADPDWPDAMILFQSFLQPPTLYLVEPNGALTALRSLPAQFDASGLLVEQRATLSKDGTRVPYFLIRAKDAPLDGEAPTLLYAYGGFNVPMLPGYSGSLGRLWLKRGGAYALANIRGGGEFGPAWHDAGLKLKRQVVFDDFIAVAEDLIDKKITSPRRLGIMGGSNGGLLMGVMLTQRPELFRAVVVQVPLLDMERYHLLLAGASWIDEYGDPKVPEEKRYLKALSPYANLRQRPDFPIPLFVTSTKDDRVHPGHARKYAAKMQALGMPFFYYENTDGGHAAGANLREQAHRRALEFTYLSERLMAKD